MYSVSAIPTENILGNFSASREVTGAHTPLMSKSTLMLGVESWGWGWDGVDLSLSSGDDSSFRSSYKSSTFESEFLGIERDICSAILNGVINEFFKSDKILFKASLSPLKDPRPPVLSTRPWVNTDRARGNTIASDITFSAISPILYEFK